MFLLAAAAALVAAAAATPTQFHLSYAGDASMRVAWKSAKEVFGSGAECAFGTHPARLTSVAPATIRSYLAPAHGYHYSALLEALDPGAPFFYRCGDAAAVRNGTAPAARGAAAPLAMAVFGDWGWCVPSASARAAPPTPRTNAQPQP